VKSSAFETAGDPALPRNIEAMTDTAELWRVPVTYAAIGATQAEDLLR